MLGIIQRYSEMIIIMLSSFYGINVVEYGVVCNNEIQETRFTLLLTLPTDKYLRQDRSLICFRKRRSHSVFMFITFHIHTE